MAFAIDKFRTNALNNSGARANLFEVEIKDVNFFGNNINYIPSTKQIGITDFKSGLFTLY